MLWHCDACSPFPLGHLAKLRRFFELIQAYQQLLKAIRMFLCSPLLESPTRCQRRGCHGMWSSCARPSTWRATQPQMLASPGARQLLPWLTRCPCLYLLDVTQVLCQVYVWDVQVDSCVRALFGNATVMRLGHCCYCMCAKQGHALLPRHCMCSFNVT